MKENIVKTKSFQFAIDVIHLAQKLQIEKREFVLSRQIIRSETSIGAMIREAENAESKADFIHKLSIARKEANESKYWLELLIATDFLKNQDLLNKSYELYKLLTSIIISAKKRNH